MNKKLHYTLVLTCVCLGSALGLAGTFVLTEGKIEARRKQKITNALATVQPTAKFDLDAADQGKDGVYRGTDSNGGTVYAAIGSAQGYSSKVVVLVGFKPDKTTVQGIRVIEQQETPGLGANIQKESTSKTLWTVLGLAKESSEIPLSFQGQFAGKTTDSLQLVKIPQPDKITAITGATISSAAVMRAVRAAGAKVREAAGDTTQRAAASADGSSS